MRPFGGTAVLENPVAPDTVGSIVISSALAVVAQDYPAGAQLVRFSGASNLWLDLASTRVAVPTSSSLGTTTAGSQNIQQLANFDRVYQIPGGSTGYSIIGVSSGAISAEFWHK